MKGDLNALCNAAAVSALPMAEILVSIQGSFFFLDHWAAGCAFLQSVPSRLDFLFLDVIIHSESFMASN